MRVAVVISQTPPIASGVARIAARMESGLRERGCEVDVFSAWELPRVFRGEYRFVYALPLFREMLERQPYDVINIHGPVPTFSDVLLLLCSASRQRFGKAQIVYTHHWDVDISRTTASAAWVYNSMTRIIARQADLVVASSAAYCKSFARFVPDGRRRVIPWGMDNCFLHSAVPQKNDEFTMLYVGQLRPYKGVDVLLRAFAHLEGCRLVIAGDGHCREKYAQLAKTLGLQNATFLGRVSDQELRNLYATSHVVVLPSVSRLEAFGIVLLEGMGAGCVPVASRLPGVADTVADAGYTFPVGDVLSLAHTMDLLKSDRRLLNRLSHRAWRRAQTYSWDATCQGYMRAFVDVCQRGLELQIQHVPLSFLTEFRFPNPL
jgi:rhamnosyl/mannosyltransferase